MFRGYVSFWDCTFRQEVCFFCCKTMSIQDDVHPNRHGIFHVSDARKLEIDFEGIHVVVPNNGTPWKRRVNLVFQQANKQSRLKGFGDFQEEFMSKVGFSRYFAACYLIRNPRHSEPKIETLLETSHEKDYPATNSEFTSEHGWLGDQFPFGMAYLQGRIVSFRDSIRKLFFFGCRFSEKGML